MPGTAAINAVYSCLDAGLWPLFHGRSVHASSHIVHMLLLLLCRMQAIRVGQLRNQ
jgi:hypothetical protein